MQLGFVYSILRVEDKMLLDKARGKGVDVVKIRDADCAFEFAGESFGFDAVLNRSLSFYKSLYASRFFEANGVACVNSFEVIRTCGDKALTSLALEKAGVPSPRTVMAFSRESALQAAQKIGFPVVLKPVVGSWARFVSKASDAESLEAILEHKEALGPLHAVYYVQEFVNKPDRDVRAFTVGDETVAAIYRNSPHWITNTARGGTASECKVAGELNELCAKAAEAVGGGVLSIDLMERGGELVVHEVNHSTEFRNSIAPTGVDIPGKIIDFVLQAARK